jgi:hypothetical protein
MVLDSISIVDDIELDDNITRLFESDHIKSFVSGDYQKELEMMLKSPTIRRPGLEEMSQDCSVSAIERIASEVMVEVLDSDVIDCEEYLGLISRLTELANEFMDTGRYEEILNIYNALYPHTLHGCFKQETSSIMDFLHSDEFISKLVYSFRLWGRKDREAVIRLSKVLRNYIVSPLIDVLSEEDNSSLRRFLLSVLIELRSGVAAEATKRLDDERWYVVRNMLYLIRECKGKIFDTEVRKLLRHENPKLRMEAVKTLLEFNKPEAVSHIKFNLKSNDPELRDRAIKLAAAYRVSDAVPELINLLGKKDMLGTESHYKKDVVRALGKIGDERTLDTLHKIACSKSLLYKDSNKELKVEIFRNLENYPLDTLKPLIELGRRSKNEEIRYISEKIFLKQKALKNAR